MERMEWSKGRNGHVVDSKSDRIELAASEAFNLTCFECRGVPPRVGLVENRERSDERRESRDFTGG